MKRATLHAVRSEDVARAPIGAPGLVLGGKYRLDEPIARGGSARVWRASHVTLNRPVAVKFVDGAGATAEERVDRFLREAKVAASVRHKNVVDIIDFGVVSGADGSDEPYMVMELLEGGTLDARLVKGAIPTREVVHIGLQILNGLDAVHRADIVHRDLKPGNVFLTDDQDGLFARLLDFGISQGAGEEHAAESVVVGTPEYMSPEQAFGDPIDARSDLYAVGVMLYEMLAGVVPFEHADPQEVVELVAHGTPTPLVELRPDVPRIAAVVSKAMAREPGDRYATARQMRQALLEANDALDSSAGLQVAQDSHPSGVIARGDLPTGAAHPARRDPRLTSGERSIEGLPAPPPARRSLGWVVGVVVLVLVAAVGGWLAAGRSGTADGPVAPATAVPAPAPVPIEPVALEPAVPAVEPVIEPAVQPVAEPAVEPAAEPPSRRRRHSRGGTHRSQESAPHGGGSPIVRELDF